MFLFELGRLLGPAGNSILIALMSPSEEMLKSVSAVVVTGGSSGIGKSFIELSAKMVPGLPICNLSRRSPDIIIDKLNLRHIPCDLKSIAQIQQACTEVEAFLNALPSTGPILLINNSGFGGYGVFPEPSLEHQLEMIDVNVKAVVALTGVLLPALRERGGIIITVASVAAFQATPYMAVYGATKAFVLNWSLAINEEFRGKGVRAFALCPGPTDTQFFDRAGMRKGSVSASMSQTADQVVVECLAAVACGKPFVVTGWKNRVLAGLASLAPKAIAARVAARMLERYRLMTRRP